MKLIKVFVLLLTLFSAGKAIILNSKLHDCDCGRVNKIPNEPRTETPWTAAIYYRSNNHSKFKFLITGSVIGKSTILTVSGGRFGGPPRAFKRNYFLHPPGNYLVVVGASSTSLDQIDKFSQLSGVSYVLPYGGYGKDNKNFHFILYHLSEPFNLSTPYVRSICLPFVLKGIKASPYNWQFIQGGFISPPDSNGAKQLKVFNVTAGTKDSCSSSFRFHYANSNVSHVFCAKMTPRDVNEEICHGHGSVAAFAISDRWYIGGIIALIPSRKQDICGNDTLYFYARTLAHLDWIYQSYNCSPFKFACSDGTCIPLSQVCNTIPNCPKGEDEEEILCEASNRCNPKLFQYGDSQCGLNEKCIKAGDICNGRKDCLDGNDEDEEKCRKLKPLKIKEPKKCPLIEKTQGLQILCFDNTTQIDCVDATDGSEAVLTCDKFNRPVFSKDFLEIKCSSGKWKGIRPFECEPECGVAIRNIESEDTLSFPWHAGIFKKEMNNGNFKIFCSGTLIEPKFLVTSGTCAKIIDDLVLKDDLKVVISPMSYELDQNFKSLTSQILNIDQAFVRESPNDEEIGLIKLKESVKLGSYIRSACYSGRINSNIGSMGKVSGFNLKFGNNRPTDLKSMAYSDYKVTSNEKCTKIFNSNLFKNFCGGFKNGTGLCKEDLGGGFFENDIHTSYERYFIKGVSIETEQTKPKKNGDCSKSYNLFARFASHVDWIMEMMERNS